MKPEISIIIPCYNCADTLEEAVDSVYASSLEMPYEVVLVDDASIDDTAKVINKLIAKYPNLRHFSHTENQGGGATRNTAVSHTSGDLIFCLDSDDLLVPNTLGRLVSYQHEKQCDGVGVSTSIKFKGRNTSDVAFVNEFSYVGDRIPFESLLEKDGVTCSLYSTFLITRKAFDLIGGYPTEHGFDTQGMAWRFLAAGMTAYTCPETTYLHRIGFHPSYYVRESNAGRQNYNWQDIFFEHFGLFDDATQEFIRTYDCKDFSKNIFDELKKRGRVFRPNFIELLDKPQALHHPQEGMREYIRRDSAHGIFLRLRSRLKKLFS